VADEDRNITFSIVFQTDSTGLEQARADVQSFTAEIEQSIGGGEGIPPANDEDDSESGGTSKGATGSMLNFGRSTIRATRVLGQMGGQMVAQGANAARFGVYIGQVIQNVNPMTLGLIAAATAVAALGAAMIEMANEDMQRLIDQSKSATDEIEKLISAINRRQEAELNAAMGRKAVDTEEVELRNKVSKASSELAEAEAEINRRAEEMTHVNGLTVEQDKQLILYHTDLGAAYRKLKAEYDAGNEALKNLRPQEDAIKAAAERKKGIDDLVAALGRYGKGLEDIQLAEERQAMAEGSKTGKGWQGLVQGGDMGAAGMLGVAMEAMWEANSKKQEQMLALHNAHAEQAEKAANAAIEQMDVDNLSRRLRLEQNFYNAKHGLRQTDIEREKEVKKQEINQIENYSRAAMTVLDALDNLSSLFLKNEQARWAAKHAILVAEAVVQTIAEIARAWSCYGRDYAEMAAHIASAASWATVAGTQAAEWASGPGSAGGTAGTGGMGNQWQKPQANTVNIYLDGDKITDWMSNRLDQKQRHDNPAAVQKGFA